MQVHQGGLGASRATSSRSGSHRGRGGSGGSGKGFKRFKVIAIILLVLAVLFGGAYAVLYNMNVFKITKVEVKGAEKLSSEYLTQLVDITEGSTLINVSTSSISSRLKENPWVESVRVRRSFPDTIVLKITEAKPCAVVKVEPDSALGAIEYWLIDSDGRWMSKVSSNGVEAARKMVIDSTDEAKKAEEAQKAEEEAKKKAQEAKKAEEAKKATEGADAAKADDKTADTKADGAKADDKASDTKSDAKSDDKAADASKDDAAGDGGSQKEPSVCEDAYITVAELAELPFISGVTSGVVAQNGVTADDEGLLNALAIVDEMDDEFGAQIATIDAATDDTTTIILKSGVEIAFGKATDVNSKIEVIEKLLEEHPNAISYINVRVVSNPVWRGL